MKVTGLASPDGTRQPVGFAAMDPEQRREMGRRGGKRAQALGKVGRFTGETAPSAGAKGGHATLARHPDHMHVMAARSAASRAKKAGKA